MTWTVSVHLQHGVVTEVSNEKDKKKAEKFVADLVKAGIVPVIDTSTEVVLVPVSLVLQFELKEDP